MQLILQIKELRMSNIEIQSLLQRSNIETNKLFQRLAEKTQVCMPMNGQTEVIKNRLTHSYEVATSSLLMAANITNKLNLTLNSIDYKSSLYSVGLLHDVGHCPFGHDGAYILNKYFSNLGLKDGFSDNNNNLIVVEKNNIIISDYTMASIIKYPKNLYPFQKDMYLDIINIALDDDINHFKTIGINLKNQKLTITCQIMDEADRNSYVCSDLADFLCLGNTIDIRELKQLAKSRKLEYRYSELNTLSNIIKSGSKTSIKAYFNDLKNRFNMNYVITDDGITVVDEDLLSYREFLSFIENEFYIKPLRQNQNHLNNMVKFEKYINAVVEDGYMPSRHYGSLIESATTDIEKYTLMRDMIGETTDWYVLNFKK